jgi:hypothetical protein
MQKVSAGLQDVLGMTQWRKAHPKATLREFEEVVDAQMNQLRAQLIQELVHMGEVGEWSEEPPEARPRCERCGTVLVSHGKQTRWLQTNGGEAVKLERRYGTCPQRGYGIFPLDEQLGLDGAGLTPRGQEALVRPAAWMSFEQAGQLLGDLLGIGVSATSTRRYTYQAGQTALELQHDPGVLLLSAGRCRDH